MLADHTAKLVTAARARALDTLARAERAIADAEAHGQPLSVNEFVARAGVSRAWFYGQPQLRQRLHEIGQGPRHARTPSDDTASKVSLHRRLELAHDRIRQLMKQNQQLEQQLSRALGQTRHREVRR